MNGKRHSEEQIIAILKQSEAGMKTVDVCRQAPYRRLECADGGYLAITSDPTFFGAGHQPGAGYDSFASARWRETPRCPQ